MHGGTKEQSQQLKFQPQNLLFNSKIEHEI